ncbi:hypothetical protein QBC36DRAFT_389852 [Triangularia setosa]|uniref:Uncharacterized protein n=1 Tax=Triangularia setosa TaxID=2587417 RepID=A0AAN6W170_9PEZI|nr:hypothetical protein QBC36DRAFT_389852 [Podospora setosa]
MANYRPGPHQTRHYHYHHNLPYVSATARPDSPDLDGIGKYIAQHLVPAIRDHSERPLKLILNFGHMEDTQGASNESSNTIIYNAPGASMTVREAGLQLKSDPSRVLAPACHPPGFRSPSPVRAIIGGVEDEDYDRRYFRDPSPDVLADPDPGIRYFRRQHFPSPSPTRQPSNVRRSLRPVLHNRVLDGQPHAQKVIGSTIQERLLHSHAHPHARFCRGCHHRHRKVNIDGYCPECVYVLQTAPLPHRRVVDVVPGPRVRHVPVSELDEIKERADRMAETKRLRRAALERTERMIPRERMLRANPRLERRHPELIIAETDNTSDEYEFVGARGRRFGKNDWS